MSTNVLLVAEDDEMDALLLQRALHKNGDIFRMIRVQNGTELIAYLQGDGAYHDRRVHPWPSLLLLDLKMPQTDGFVVLDWRRSQVAERRLPAIVFSSSNLRSDIERAYDLGASSYVVKPTAPERLEEMVRALKTWWLEFNLPAPQPAV